MAQALPINRPFNALHRACQESNNQVTKPTSLPRAQYKVTEHIWKKAKKIIKRVNIDVESRDINHIINLRAKLQKQQTVPLDPCGREAWINASNYLIRMSSIGIVNHYNLGNAVLTAYHQSGKTLQDFMGANVNRLCDGLREINVRFGDNLYFVLNCYLSAFGHLIALPLPQSDDDIKIGKYDDDMGIIVRYIDEINNALNGLVLGKNAPYPLQFDLRFVAPGTANPPNMDLHNLNGTEFECEYFRNEHISNKTCDAIWRFLRESKAIRNANCQRFTLLIVRGDRDNISNDSWYIIKAKENNSIPHPSFSDYCDLSFFLNSKSDIVPGLSSSAEGVLGLSHHFHSSRRNNVYLSYGKHQGIVTKSSMIEKLQSVCVQKISEKLIAYKDFQDDKANDGVYWFGDDCMKSQWKLWNPKGNRAQMNIWISKECTSALIQYVDESAKFRDSAEVLYYNFDYNLLQQIADDQVMIHVRDGLEMCVIPTDWHKYGKLLYALVVPNPRFYHAKDKNKMTGLRWKIIDYKHISEAFPTGDAVVAKYGIDIAELHKGSRFQNNDWKEQKNAIDIIGNKEAIKKSVGDALIIKRKRLPQIVQSKTQKNKIRDDKKNAVIAKLSRDEFFQSFEDCLDDIKQDDEFECIAQIDSQSQKYYVEKLIFVHLQRYGYDAYVAVQFMATPNGIPKIMRIGLDHFDLTNKANLICGKVSPNSMLRQMELKSVDRLIIDDERAKQQKSIAIEQQEEHKSNGINFAAPIAVNYPHQFVNPYMHYMLLPIGHVLQMHPALKKAAGIIYTDMAKDCKTEKERKRKIGEYLYPLIEIRQPLLAGTITEMLLSMSNMDPLVLAWDLEALNEKIDEAVAVLKNHQYNKKKEFEELKLMK